jgi:hypothetical protein
MLDLSTAVLCDFAQVRDRLLFVSSGAVSRLYRQELPSPLGLMVGLIIEVPLEDAGMEHRLRAEVINRHGTVLATLENLFRVSDAGLFPHEVQQVPLVLSVTGVRARTWGTHQVRLYLDDDLVRALTLYVVPAAGPQAVVRATPTQSRVADDEGSLGGTGTDGVAAEPDPNALPAEDSPLTWGSPAGDPAPEPVPVAADDAESHEIVIDLDTSDEDGELVTILPDAAPEDADAGAEPSPETSPEPSTDEEPMDGPATAPFTWDTPLATPEPTPEPDPEPEPEPEPQREAPVEATTSPWASTATISAPRAQEPTSPEWRTSTPAPPVTDPEPSPHVFDFDEDDLDADPADRQRSVPSAAPSTAEQDKSRFSFRYRYDDEADDDGPD